MITDIKYVVLGIKETLFKVLNWRLVLQNKSQIYLLFADFVLCLVSLVLAHMLRFDGLPLRDEEVMFLPLLLVVALVRIPCFVYCGLYSTLIRHLSVSDILSVCKGVVISSIILVSLTMLLNFRSFSRAVFLIDALCLILLMSSLRCVIRLFWQWKATNNENGSKRVLIFGAGNTGYLAYQFLMAEKEQPFEIMGYLDDDPVKCHKTLHGKKVLGNRFTLEAVVKLYQIQEIILAMPSVLPHALDEVMHACKQARVHCWNFPTLKNASRLNGSTWQEVSRAEILGTHDMQMDAEAVRQILHGKRVLLTGACGALGVELCRQILHFSPQKLVIIDRYEAYLTELLSRLLSEFTSDQVVPILCPPTPNGTIANVFHEYQPQVVFHTTTRKYPPLFDIQGENVFRVNWLSTFELAKQAASSGCEYFVMVSSEEAEKRGNSLSDSLRAAEISLHKFFAATQTTLVIVRLCDILENCGSMMAMLQEQLAHREPVTLPYPDAKRHVLSGDAAVRFILQSLVLAGSLPTEQGIFVYNHSASVSLMDLASKLAKLRGVQLEYDHPVRYLNGTPVHDQVSHLSPDDQGKIVTTAHTHIGLLRHTSLPDSPEVKEAFRYLFSLQEHDLEHAELEKHANILCDVGSPS